MNEPITTNGEVIAEALSDVIGIESADVATVGSVDIASAERKLRADAARNRQRVLTAAAQVFAERGLDVSLDEVAMLPAGPADWERQGPGDAERARILLSKAETVADTNGYRTVLRRARAALQALP
jgi:hypothetical protein